MDDYIKKEVARYFKSEGDRAIMINGKWGSGKTYYVKNVLIPYLSNEMKEFKTIHISLYGITDINMLNKEMVLEMFRVSQNKIHKVVPYISPVLEIAQLTYPKANIYKILPNYINKDSVSNFFSGLNKYNIIFDDLERSSLDYLEILGYINQLCEHSENNIVIVVNEEELRKKENVKNNELKYIVSLLSKDIGDSHSIKPESLSKETNQSIDSFEKLKRKKDLIFIEETSYLDIKEKTVFRTFLYEPDYNNVYDKVLMGMKNITSIVPKKYKKIIIDIIGNENIQNVRTLKTIFRNLDFFYNMIKEECKLAEDNLSEKNYQVIVENIVRTTVNIEHNINTKNKDLLNDITPNLYESFVKEHMAGKKINKNKLIKTSHIIIDSYIDEDKNIIYKMNSFWSMNDDEVQKNIDHINIQLKKHRYPKEYYATILYYNVLLKQLGFELDIDTIIMDLEDNIRKKQESSINFSIDVIENEISGYLNNESLVYIKKKLNDLQKISTEIENNSFIHKLYEVFSEDRMSSISDILYENRETINQYGGWLHLYNIDFLEEKLLKCDNKTFVYFLRTVNDDLIYKGNIIKYSNDFLYFIRFYNMLKNLDLDSNIKMKIFTIKLYIKFYQEGMIKYNVK